jgi:uncharacterized membrane protein
MVKRKREARWENMIFGSAIGGVLLLVVIMMGFINNAVNEVPNFMQNSPVIPAIALICMLITFQVLDKKHFGNKRLKKHLKQRQ